jgi:hypothetical protein
MAYHINYEKSTEITPISMQDVSGFVHPLEIYVLYSSNIPHYFNTSSLCQWINYNNTNPLTREPISEQIKNRIIKYNEILINTPELYNADKCTFYKNEFIKDLSRNNIDSSNTNYYYYQACIDPIFFMNLSENLGIHNRSTAKTKLTDMSGYWLIRKSSLQVADDNTFPFVISYNKDGRIYHTALVRRRGLGYYSLNSISSGNIVTNNIDQYFHANTLLDFILKNKILLNFNKIII